MARNLDSEPKYGIEIKTKSGASKDDRTFYTRLDLPKNPIPNTLKIYWSSTIHQEQTKILENILRG